MRPSNHQTTQMALSSIDIQLLKYSMKPIQAPRRSIDHHHHQSRRQLTFPTKNILLHRCIASGLWLLLVCWWCCQFVSVQLTDDFPKTAHGLSSTEQAHFDSENMVEDNDDAIEKRYRHGNRLRSLNEEPNLSSLSPSHPHSHHSGSEHNHDYEWNFTQVNLANSHLFYIRTKYSCSTPRAKLIKVLDYHPTPSKQYVPRCTVLHRCDDESGCCEDVTHRCEASKTELVNLYFHVIRSDIKNNITGGSAVGIERLTFLNHTQCECKPINYMPRTMSHRPPLRLVAQAGSNKRQSDGYQKCKHVINCPEPFIQRFRDADQRCVCDCGNQLHRSQDLYKQCLDIQAGVDKLKPFWARCVRSEECSEPVCSFGSLYSQSESRCVASDQIRHQHGDQHLRHHNRRHHYHHHHPHHHRRHNGNNDTNSDHSFLQLWMRQRNFPTSSLN